MHEKTKVLWGMARWSRVVGGELEVRAAASLSRGVEADLMEGFCPSHDTNMLGTGSLGDV